MRKIFGINHTSTKGGKVMGNSRRFWARILPIAAFAVAFGIMGGQQRVNATIITLTDGNATAQIDPHSQAGMYSWIIDGVEHMEKQWFWYRVGSSGPEASVDTLTLGSHSPVGPMVWVNYSSASFNMAIGYVLTGGSAGSGTADMAEIISIKNTSASNLAFHFFQYTDFDLSGTPNDDTARRVNTNKWEQTDGTFTVAETVGTGSPIPEVALFPTTLSKLNDASATTLDGSTGPLGPGNVAFAWQWDVTITPGNTFLISKDKKIGVNPVPEPATIALLGTGLLGMLGYSRRRFGKKG